MEVGSSKLTKAIELTSTDPKASEIELKLILSTPSGKLIFFFNSK